MNPGGSVKDRAARSIVERAWSQGELKPGGVLLDASSGNTGIAYAMLAAALGFKLKLCLPANANPERKRTLIAYGAELILTDPAEDQMALSSKHKSSQPQIPLGFTPTSTTTMRIGRPITTRPGPSW